MPDISWLRLLPSRCSYTSTSRAAPRCPEEPRCACCHHASPEWPSGMGWGWGWDWGRCAAGTAGGGCTRTPAAAVAAVADAAVFQRGLISSRSRPLVSGTQHTTKHRPHTEMAAYSQKAPCRPSACWKSTNVLTPTKAHA
ncbi:Cystic fibrosis transmembrane conductance regulator [Frankliniella fusca]|uniref:Cystic fibrosis transmembrane conductance regulator n=1 Tax=Frankliniella fusca TaxID=407009 RepID=A0AAE1H2F0_9NEOP|nr:Cystic fibrosis transmembrane conductance regulator [Frankliniella fusca]